MPFGRDVVPKRLDPVPGGQEQRLGHDEYIVILELVRDTPSLPYSLEGGGSSTFCWNSVPLVLPSQRAAEGERFQSASLTSGDL